MLGTDAGFNQAGVGTFYPRDRMYSSGPPSWRWNVLSRGGFQASWRGPGPLPLGAHSIPRIECAGFDFRHQPVPWWFILYQGRSTRGGNLDGDLIEQYRDHHHGVFHNSMFKMELREVHYECSLHCYINLAGDLIEQYGSSTPGTGTTTTELFTIACLRWNLEKYIINVHRHHYRHYRCYLGLVHCRGR